MKNCIYLLLLFYVMVTTSCDKNEEEYFVEDISTNDSTGEDNTPTYSIIGNSISTFRGYIPNEYKTYYPQPWLNDANDTWWIRIGKTLNMKFLANASWSASTVSGDAISCFTSDNRIAYLSANGVPDYIFVAGGTNDYGKNKPIGQESDDNELTSSTFRGAYSLMLNKMKEMYPNAKIICLAIFPRSEGYDRKNSKGWTIRDANNVIESLSEKYDCYFINMEGCGLEDDINGLTSDGLHPNSKGMELIANHICNVFNSILEMQKTNGN